MSIWAKFYHTGSRVAQALGAIVEAARAEIAEISALAEASEEAWGRQVPVRGAAPRGAGCRACTLQAERSNEQVRARGRGKSAIARFASQAEGVSTGRSNRPAVGRRSAAVGRNGP